MGVLLLKTVFQSVTIGGTPCNITLLGVKMVFGDTSRTAFNETREQGDGARFAASAAASQEAFMKSSSEVGLPVKVARREGSRGPRPAALCWRP